MTTGRTPNLDLALPVEGELDGTWGDEVNNGITDYVDIAIAGTLTLNGDGAVTLVKTQGSSAGDNIGNTTAQYAIIRVTGTLTATKIITAPASSKTYVLINDATGDSVTIKASGQTGVTAAVGQKVFVAYNGTDYVKVGGDGDVTLNGSQTLTNKTISVDNNTVSGIPASSFVLSNASGNIDGAAAQKAIPVGAVVGTTDSQTLTNKTISVDDNTVSGIAASSFVLSNVSGNIDGSAAQKAIPAGVVVGTTDSQTLTNKTISADSNTLGGIAASSFVLSDASGNIDGAAAQKAIPAGVVVGTTDTQTLTNKRVTPRSVDIASASTITPTSDTADQYEVTALAVPATVAAPSGTPTDGQKLVLRFKDNGTDRALTWTTGSSGSYRAVGVTLPTTTFANKTIYVGCIYNAADSRWDVVAVATEA